MDVSEILDFAERENVAFIRLQFTDLDGTVKGKEIPFSRLGDALENGSSFDGSSISGFARIEESDMVLVPDLDTFLVLPWRTRKGAAIARIICDTNMPDGSEFESCPRRILRRQERAAAEMGFSVRIGPEVEFFLLLPDGTTHDRGRYFDVAPSDLGEEVRRELILALDGMGFEVEAGHHEVAPGQHEIGFRSDTPVATADRVATMKHVIPHMAHEEGLMATFMPKPILGENGSGMHVNQSLFDMDGNNAFHDPGSAGGISGVARNYIAGLLEHARGMAAVTNPTVNSYKRLVPGYEAPTNIAWSMGNRSPLVRVPDARGPRTRCELRMPDPSCNPYLAFAVMIAAGLDGVRRRTEPPPEVNGSLFEMSDEEREAAHIESLPENLSEAVQLAWKSGVLERTLGPETLDKFLASRKREWDEYSSHVHPWERRRYLC